MFKLTKEKNLILSTSKYFSYVTYKIVRIINALSYDWNLHFVAALIFQLNSNEGLVSH